MTVVALPTIRRGDDWDYVGTFALTTGSLVGCTVWMTLKNALSDADAAAVLQISTTGGGVTVVGATTLELVLTAAQTAALVPKKHWVDIQVKTPGGKIITVDNLAEATVVEADVTRAIA
jgi:hypothetical protein